MKRQQVQENLGERQHEGTELADLARLYKAATRSGPALREFHSLLLGPTLENAATTGFYRRHWGTLAPLPENFSRLPVVRKADLRSAGREAQVRSDVRCIEIYTSGSTGRPFISVRSTEELKFTQAFFRALYSDHDGKPLRRTIQFQNPYHGAPIPIPAPVHAHALGIYDRGSLDRALEILTGDHSDPDVEPHVTAIIGIERILRAFCLHAERTLGRPVSSHLEAIVSSTQYVTPAWRRRFREVFGCALHDRFSLSEVTGGASDDPESGWYLYDPSVYPEVVGATSGMPIDDGVGVLVVTSLFPFQQAQPMVRYWTGDVVRVKRSADGRLLFRPLGREHFGVLLPGTDTWLLEPHVVYEYLDEAEGVYRHPRFLDVLSREDAHAIGHPVFAIDHGERHGKIRITVRVMFSPSASDRSIRKIRLELEDCIRSSNPAIDDDVILEIAELNDGNVPLFSYATG